MLTAGRAVVFSGGAVAIGLALLLFMPLPFIRGFGLGGLVIPAVSVAAAVTLLPAVLSLVGRPLDRVRLLPRSWIERRADHETGFWAVLASFIMRYPKLVAGSTAALLVALALPVLTLELGPGSNGVPRELESIRGLALLSDAVGAGATAPTQIVVDTEATGGPRARQSSGPHSSRAALLLDPQVADVVFDETPEYVDPSGRFLHVEVAGESEYGRPESLEFVERLRDEIIPRAGFPDSAAVYAGGGPPAGRTSSTSCTAGSRGRGSRPRGHVLPAHARFRSIVLPLKAIVLNLLSIGAAYGLLVIVFKWGRASGRG